MSASRLGCHAKGEIGARPCVNACTAVLVMRRGYISHVGLTTTNKRSMIKSLKILLPEEMGKQNYGDSNTWIDVATEKNDGLIKLQN